MADMQLISQNCCRFNDPSALISVLARELTERMTLIAQGKLDSALLSKLPEDESLTARLPAPEKLQEKMDEIHEVKLNKRKQKGIEEEEHEELEEKPSTIVSLKLNKEDEGTETRGMRLRPKKIINFKNIVNNDIFGRDYHEERDEPTRRSLRQASKKEDTDILGRRSNTMMESSNNPYSTRLRSRRLDSLFDDKVEKREEHAPVLANQQQIVKEIEPEVEKELEVPMEENKKEEDHHGIRIKLKKQPKTSTRNQRIEGESFILEAIEEDNLGWRGDELNNDKEVEVKNGKTFYNQNSKESIPNEKEQNGTVITLSRANTTEEGIRTRLRRPGKSYAHLFEEEQYENFEDDEEEFEEKEEKLGKTQLKYNTRQLRKQQVQQSHLERDKKLSEVKESDTSLKITIPAPVNQRETRSKRTLALSQMNQKEEDENFEEAPTKIRLTLPKETLQETTESQQVPKRYSTRSAKR